MKKILLITIGLSISLLADFSRDDNTQIVTDNETGLQWQYNEYVRRTWQDAINYCEALTLGSHDDWRLPNRNELGSLVDYTRTNPSISAVFKYTASYDYWSSTTYANYSYNAWHVDFSLGAQNNGDKSYKYNNYFVRCVRAGQ